MFQTLRSFQELSAAQTQSLYGPDAAKLYDQVCPFRRLVFAFLSFVLTLNCAVSNSQASQVNEKARDSYMAAMDTYYKANQQADYGSFIILCFLPNYDQSRLLSSELKLACWHVFSVLTSALICKNRHPQEVNGAVGSHVHDPSISRHDAVNLAEQTVHIYVSERTYILFSSMTPSFCEGRK